jgi:nucleosome binding factor SPN SPT16 subunit
VFVLQVEIVDGEQMSVATSDIPKELREITYLVGEDDEKSEDEKPKEKKKKDKSSKGEAAQLDPTLGVRGVACAIGADC